MGISEIAALIIVLLTIGVSIYKNSQKMTVLKAVIMGVEESIDGAPEVIKKIIARNAKDYGIGKVLSKLVKKFTT